MVTIDERRPLTLLGLLNLDYQSTFFGRNLLQDNRELLEPLQLCYQSLHACGMGVIADGPLLDFLRRAVTFACFWCASMCVRTRPVTPRP